MHGPTLTSPTPPSPSPGDGSYVCRRLGSWERVVALERPAVVNTSVSTVRTTRPATSRNGSPARSQAVTAAGRRTYTRAADARPVSAMQRLGPSDGVGGRSRWRTCASFAVD